MNEFERFRKIRKVLGWVLLGNLAVAAAKIIYGQISGSLSIRADGLHSLADSASNIIGLIALSKSGDEPDSEHPYGHRKLEVAGAIGIGFLIFVGLLEIGQALLKATRHSYPLFVGPGGFTVVLVTLAVNIFVARQEKIQGERLKSPILAADAKHTLSDIFATLGVFASFIGTRMGWPGVDVAASALIMLLVGRAAYVILKQGIDVLLDRSQLDIGLIEKTVESVGGVIDCHRVRSRGMPGAVFVDCHILVDSKLTMEAAHRITHEAETAIKEKFPEVIDVVIHTEPDSDGREPYPWEKK